VWLPHGLTYDDCAPTVIHLRLFTWSRQNYRAWLQWLVTQQLAHVALNRLMATVEPILGNQVLPDCVPSQPPLRPNSMAFTKRLAGTGR